MLYLPVSIILTSYLVPSFRIVQWLHIDSFQVIVFNYIIYVITGSVVNGIAIGVPNYFSIWCLLKILKQNPGRSAAIIPVNNTGIVLFSAVVAGLAFNERVTLVNRIGIGLSIISIALIAYT
jgi:uncharacterized membrane protein